VEQEFASVHQFQRPLVLWADQDLQQFLADLPAERGLVQRLNRLIGQHTSAGGSHGLGGRRQFLDRIDCSRNQGSQKERPKDDSKELSHQNDLPLALRRWTVSSASRRTAT